MISQTEEAVLALIRKALDAGSQIDCSLFDGVDWTAVFDFVSAQGVAGLCLDAMEDLEPSCKPDEDNLFNWIGQVGYMEARFERYQEAIRELAKFYQLNGIKMMILKGYGLSQYWPQPAHRLMGDVDVYLGHLWQFADQMVHDKLGITIDNSHEHHTTFRLRGVLVENHYDFINTKAHKDAPAIEERLKRLATMDNKNILSDSSNNEISYYLPSADFNVIFMIRHLGQHFAGERITLRQVLDWGLFLQAESGKVNWDDVIPFLKEMKIWTFFNQINAICQDYLGIRFCEGMPAIERNGTLETTRIFEDILHPEFAEEKPLGTNKVLRFKLKRWWHNRWKHQLVYNEWLLPMFITLLWSHLRRIDTLKD